MSQTLILARILLSVVLVLPLAGCWTYRANSDAKQTKLIKLPKRSENVALVMDADYREYAKKDRGHAIADPQTYELGESLTQLTETYFAAVFPSVLSVRDWEELDSETDVDLIVTMGVEHFDNDLDLFVLGATRQHFTIHLDAVVSTSDRVRVGTFRGQVKETREDSGMFWETSDSVEYTLGLAIQEALSRLLVALDDGIPK